MQDNDKNKSNIGSKPENPEVNIQKKIKNEEIEDDIFIEDNLSIEDESTTKDVKNQLNTDNTNKDKLVE